MSRLLQLLVCLLAFGLPATAAAHALAPSVLTISADKEGRIAATWRYSMSDPGAADLQPVFPSVCERLEGPGSVPVEAGFAMLRWQLDCSSADAQAQLRVEGLADGPRSVLLRHEDESGIRTQLLDGGRVVAPLLPGSPLPWSETARDYLSLGVEHLVLGPDHLLFVIGLFLLVARLRQLLALTLGFTLGHSLTLGASVLGYLHLSQDVAEWGIAASIVWLAWRVLRDGAASSTGTMRLTAAACGFGLLHGLGFAGALAEIGLPESQLWLALLAFNIGIEIGQLLVVVAMLLVVRLAGLVSRGAALPQGRPGLAYLMGAMGAFWMIDRGLLLLPPIY